MVMTMPRMKNKVPAPPADLPAVPRQWLRAHRVHAGGVAVVRAVPALHPVHRDPPWAAARHPARLEPGARHRVVRRDRGRRVRLVDGDLRAEVAALSPGSHPTTTAGGREVIAAALLSFREAGPTEQFRGLFCWLADRPHGFGPRNKLAQHLRGWRHLACRRSQPVAVEIAEDGQRKPAN